MTYCMDSDTATATATHATADAAVNTLRRSKCHLRYPACTHDAHTHTRKDVHTLGHTPHHYVTSDTSPRNVVHSHEATAEERYLRAAAEESHATRVSTTPTRCWLHRNRTSKSKAHRSMCSVGNTRRAAPLHSAEASHNGMVGAMGRQS